MVVQLVLIVLILLVKVYCLETESVFQTRLIYVQCPVYLIHITTNHSKKESQANHNFIGLNNTTFFVGATDA